MDFEGFDKIPRLSRECTITEKIDGTNAQIYIGQDGEFLVGSRNRWITPESDNFGFARWAMEHKEQLLWLGPGRHFGEWWGPGIQRRYNIPEKRWSLFNTFRHTHDRPPCCDVVPILYKGIFSLNIVEEVLDRLRVEGSVAAPGFMQPEGIVIYHEAAGQYFKKTLEGDESPKGKREEVNA